MEVLLILQDNVILITKEGVKQGRVSMASYIKVMHALGFIFYIKIINLPAFNFKGVFIIAPN